MVATKSSKKSKAGSPKTHDFSPYSRSAPWCAFRDLDRPFSRNSYKPYFCDFSFFSVFAIYLKPPHNFAHSVYSLNVHNPHFSGLYSLNSAGRSRRRLFPICSTRSSAFKTGSRIRSNYFNSLRVYFCSSFLTNFNPCIYILSSNSVLFYQTHNPIYTRVYLRIS